MKKSLTNHVLKTNTSAIVDGNEISPMRISSIAYSYAHAATSANTREAYRSDIRNFIAWGGVLPATPDIIIRYLETYADSLHPNTLKRRLTAIKNWHTYQQLPDPTEHELIRKILCGITRLRGKASKQAPVLSLEQVELISDHLSRKDRLIDHRNKTLLQIGFFGAFRRSELVAVHWEHVTFTPKGIEIFIARSKTDQEGEGHVCAIPYSHLPLCPVSTLQQWREKSGRETGPIFPRVHKNGRSSEEALSSVNVTRIVRDLAIECNLPNAKTYSAHSLRRGFATSASERGADLLQIMHHGRWRSIRTVESYIEASQRFEDNAVLCLYKYKSKEADE